MKDAVGGGEVHQVQLRLGRGATQRKEVIESLGHEVPGRSGIPAEAGLRKAAGAPAYLIQRVHDGDLVALAAEQSGGGEAGDAGSNDDGVHDVLLSFRPWLRSGCCGRDGAPHGPRAKPWCGSERIPA